MALFFKGGEQLYREALDAIGRKDYSEAQKKFNDAKEKGYDPDNLCAVYCDIIYLGNNRGVVRGYRNLLDALKGVSVGTIKFGLTEMDVADLCTELELAIMEIEASNLNGDFKEKGNRLIEVAGQYMGRIGEKNLKLDEIFKGNTMATGNREALILQAEGYSVLGKGYVNVDPKMAAEYMQMAYNFRRQLGDSGEEELTLSRNFSRSATCWICGRPANGQGIHFMAMPADIEPVFQKMTDGDAVKPISEDCRDVYVCMPCYTAISNRSDEVSREYYERAREDMMAMEARLQAEITALRFSMSMGRR